MGPGLLGGAWWEDPLSRCPPAAPGQVGQFTGQWEGQCPVPMTTNLPLEHATHLLGVRWAGLVSHDRAMEEQPPGPEESFSEKAETKSRETCCPQPRQAGRGDSPFASPGRQQQAEGGAMEGGQLPRV